MYATIARLQAALNAQIIAQQQGRISELEGQVSALQQAPTPAPAPMTEQIAQAAAQAFSAAFVAALTAAEDWRAACHWPCALALCACVVRLRCARSGRHRRGQAPTQTRCPLGG